MVAKQHPDVDTGWAFIVAFAAGLCHFFTLGFSMAFSAYYVIFLQEFGESKGLTAWISSINYGMMCAMDLSLDSTFQAVGPIASVLIKHEGCRVTVFLGGVLAGVGLIVSAFAQSVFTLVITFGLITGAGYGFAFTGSIVVMSEYCNKYRVFTMGLSLAGGGLGNIVFPWILGPLLHHYDWRWALALSGALTLHICAAALFMRPISTGRKHLPTSTTTTLKATTEAHKHSWRTGVKEKVIQSLGLKLFTELAFWLVSLNTFLYCFSMSVAFTHIASFALEVGMDLYQRNMILSTLGFSGLIGRLILGGLASIPGVNIPLLFSTCYTLAGVSLIFIASRTAFIGIMIFATFYGLFAAGYGPLLSEVVFMVCGQQDFAVGYGWVMLFMAGGQFLGAPAAGFLYDATQFYPGSFYGAGVCLILSGLIILPYAVKQSKCLQPKMEERTVSVQADTNTPV